MKKFFLLFCITCCYAFVSLAQDPGVLNKYSAVFVPPLLYGKGMSDIYGIRETTIEKLIVCGIPVYKDDKEIPRMTMNESCSMLHCLVNNAASESGLQISRVYILFLDCKNDTVLYYSANANVLMTQKETRASFINVTQKTLEILNSYHYQFSGSAQPVVQSADATDDSILWSQGRKLTWDDFRGAAINDDPADALTFTCNQTLFSSFSIGSRFEAESEIRCCFIKSKSWVKPGKQIDYLLNHEQRHFDLAEAGAREFRKRMKQTHFTEKNFHTELKRTTDEVNEKYFKLQKQYDGETNHSRIEEKQKEWNAKIDALLKGLEAYK